MFAVFGAVVLVGLVGAGVISFVKGPLTTSIKQTRTNMARSQMTIAAQIAVMSAVNTSAGGDCDGDGTVEPLEFRNPGTTPVPVGGGLIPISIGIKRIDPWGTEYGYCVWDYGTVIQGTACQQTTPGTNYRLEGHATAQDTPVVAIISAGPDRKFTTTCRNYSTGPTRADQDNNGLLSDSGDLPLVGKAAANDDDVIFTYTYAQAIAATGGLWTLKSGNANVATLGKKIESYAAKFSGAAIFQKIGAAAGDFVDMVSGLRLPSPTTASTCGAANTYTIRRNVSSNAIEMCNGSSWLALGGSGGGGSFDGLSDSQTKYTSSSLFFAGDSSGDITGSGTNNTSWGIQNLITAGASGINNTALGYQALNTNTSVSYNTALGYQTILANTTTNGFSTVAGYKAGSSLGASATTLVAIGGLAYANNNVSSSMGYGYQAGASNSGTTVTAVGYNALKQGTGNINTAFGAETMQNVSSATQTVAVGRAALYSLNGSGNNTIIGSNAGYLTTGANNTAIGYYALNANTTGATNTAIGSQASRYVKASLTTSAGYQALLGNTGGATGANNVAIGSKSLAAVTTGADNTAFGYSAGNSTTTSSFNVALGYNALATSKVTGDGTVAIGSYALNSLDAANTFLGDTAVGSQALKSLAAASANTAIGYQAGMGLTTSSKNTVVGSGAQTQDLGATASIITAVGYQALKDNTGGNNTAVGALALTKNTIGVGNTAVGYNAIGSNLSGSNITAVGSQALAAYTSNYTVALGYQALAVLTNGLYNVAAGYQAGAQLTTGTYNVLAGDTAAYGLQTGSYNTVAGYKALMSNVSGNSNTAAGYQALNASTGSHNTAMGYNALLSLTTGENNTAFGYSAMYRLTKGLGNTAVGSGALGNLDDTAAFLAADCTGLGNANLNDATSGHCYFYLNTPQTWTAAQTACQTADPTSYLAVISSAAEEATAVALGSGNDRWIGGNDSAVAGEWRWAGSDLSGIQFWSGGSAGSAVDDNFSHWKGSEPAATSSCAVMAASNTGWAALSCTSTHKALCEKDPVPQASYNTAVGNVAGVNTVGSRNTFFGAGAGGTTNGNDNTGVGYGALGSNTTGSQNTAVGSYAGPSSGALNNTVAIGYNTQATATNAVRIGDQYITVIEGQVGFTATSDARLKKDIKPSDLGLDFIMSLKPVSYRLKLGNGRLDYGFLAQDIDQSLDGRVTNMITRRNDEMKTYQLRSNDLIAPLTKAVQEQDAIIQKLQDKIDAIKAARQAKACSAEAKGKGE